MRFGVQGFWVRGSGFRGAQLCGTIPKQNKREVPIGLLGWEQPCSDRFFYVTNMCLSRIKHGISLKFDLILFGFQQAEKK